MGGHPRYTVKQIADALTDRRGRVFLAAIDLGCTYQTVYNYIEKHESLAKLKEQLEGKRLDVAEDKLGEAIDRGEAWAVCFYLKTIGKHRGYVERTEQKHEGEIKVIRGPRKAQGSAEWQEQVKSNGHGS